MTLKDLSNAIIRWKNQFSFHCLLIISLVAFSLSLYALAKFSFYMGLKIRSVWCANWTPHTRKKSIHNCKPNYMNSAMLYATAPNVLPHHRWWFIYFTINNFHFNIVSRKLRVYYSVIVKNDLCSCAHSVLIYLK